jgi:hypothetical protein
MGQLLFKKCFWEPIRSGSKRTTLRRWASPRVSAGGRAYTPGVGWLRVGSVEAVELASLDEADARADGFASLDAMMKTLAEIYPQRETDGKRWFKVSFAYEDEEKARARNAKRESRDRSQPLK